MLVSGAQIIWVQILHQQLLVLTLSKLYNLCAFSSVQSLSCVQLFATPWTAAHQSSLSSTISQSLLKLMSIESMTPFNHLLLCHPLLILHSIFPASGSFQKSRLFASGYICLENHPSGALSTLGYRRTA